MPDKLLICASECDWEDELFSSGVSDGFVISSDILIQDAKNTSMLH